MGCVGRGGVISQRNHRIGLTVLSDRDAAVFDGVAAGAERGHEAHLRWAADSIAVVQGGEHEVGDGFQGIGGFHVDEMLEVAVAVVAGEAEGDERVARRRAKERLWGFWPVADIKAGRGFAQHAGVILNEDALHEMVFIAGR